MRRAVVITALLALLAAASAIGILHTSRNYARAMAVVRDFRLELCDLRVTGADEPSVAVVLCLVNVSPVGFELDSLLFTLHLNGQFIGSNYEPLSMTVPGGLQQRTLSLNIPVQPIYQHFLDQADASGRHSWSIRGRYRINLPFKEKAIWLDLLGDWGVP